MPGKGGMLPVKSLMYFTKDRIASWLDFIE
jgi:hypothetical protein